MELSSKDGRTKHGEASLEGTAQFHLVLLMNLFGQISTNMEIT